MSIFPIELRAYETPHYTSSPYAFRDPFLAAFRAANPKGHFYAFDVILLSRTEAEFVAYDMRDNLSGGIGKEIWRGKAAIPARLTKESVEQAIYKAAAARRAMELAAIENEIVAGYADEIRLALDAGA